MPAVRYPGATWQDKTQHQGIVMPKLTKVGWHTTETAGWPGYPTFAPQMTIDPIKKQRRQHMDLNRSSSTMANAGSYRVNRAGLVQIEIVAYVDPKFTGSPYFYGKWGDDEYEYLAETAAWLYQEWKIPLESNVKWVSYPGSYGLNAKQRLTTGQFEAAVGQVGHQHAPGNTHGDPSNIDMGRLLGMAWKMVGGGTVTPPPGVVPAPYAPGQILPGGAITTPFGVPGSWEAGFHTGDDWNVGEPGDDYWFPLYATKPGRVVYVGEDGWGPAYGRQVHVDYDAGRRGMFAHLAAYSVKVGDRVEPGTQIGRLGYSGNVRPEGQDGSHCHYEERIAPHRYGSDALKPVYLATTWQWDGKSYPGSERLQEGAIGPWVTLFGDRAEKWGYDGYQVGPGPEWGPADTDAVLYLKGLQGWKGGAGVGQATWDLAMSDPPKEPEVKKVRVKVGTCNIYVGNSIANGKKAVDAFAKAGCDAVGWQELSEDSDQKALTAYAQSIGWDATRRNSAVTTFYNKKTTELLSETHEVVEKGGRKWEAGAGGADSIYKIIMVTKFRDRESGRVWWLHNNHITPTIEKDGKWRSNPIRVEIAKRQFTRLAENLGESGSDLAVATGDMNVGWGDGPASDWCEAVFDKVGATVCWDQFPDEPTHTDRSIDWIVARNGDFIDIDVIDIPGGDHDGVVCTLELRSSAA